MGDGSGNFTDSGQSLGDHRSFSVSLGDVDGDGDLDAFVANASSNRVWLNQNLDFGDAPAPFPTLRADDGARHGPTGPTLGANRDSETDGQPSASADGDDTAGATPDDEDGVTIGTITAGELGATVTVNVANGPALLDAWIDFNGDGTWDGANEQIATSLAVSNGNNAVSFDVPANVVIGQQTFARFRISTAGGLGPRGQAADGEVEDHPLTIQADGGTGVFADSGQSLGDHNSYGMSLGDVDGDGDLDAFVANYSQGNRVWLGDGSGNFTDSGQSLGDHNSRSVTLGDVDGDGDLDAFVANFNQGNRVWLNDGSGNFTDSGQSLGTHDSIAVSLGDVDGDGDLDAFIANRSGDGNRVWTGDGSGNFTDSGQSLGNRSSYGVSLGDVDDDGDLDAFVANYDQDNRVWLADGSGNFTDSGQNLGNHSSYDVSLGDVDGDGDLDAFVANYNQGNLVWLNDSGGNFTDSGQGLGNHSSVGVSLGDVDSDGDLDAFVANYDQGHRVWLNENPPKVTEVLVRGSAWTQPFLDELDSLSLGNDGFSIPVGSVAQLNAVPWVNIDQILIRFSDQVNVDLADLVLTGVNVATYSFSGVTTGTGASGDFEAVWTLTAPIATDKLRIRLDGTTGGAVTNTSGDLLDGEWVDTVSTDPSGDNVVGGDFAFRFNVLPADFDGTGVITLNPDLQNMLAGNGATIGGGTYSPLIDLDGNGTVTLNPDLQTALANNGASLPAGNPSAPGSGGAGSSSVSAAFAAGPVEPVSTTDAATSELKRVIAIPPGSRALPRHLDVARFGRARAASDGQSVRVFDVLGRKRATISEVLDLDDLESNVSFDLLAEIGAIF